MTIIVLGDHPVLGNGDKVFDDIELAKEYEGGLIHYGFDNVEIKPLLDAILEGKNDKQKTKLKAALEYFEII